MSVGGYTTTGVTGITKNGTTIKESENTMTQLAQKGMKIYTTPIAFAQGDALAFYIHNVAFQPPTRVLTSTNFNYFVHELIDFDL